MKVIILCGGLGTRLKEETEFKPKPMLFVGDKPILWHIMKIYSAYGVNDFILALGYKANYIKEFFLNQKAFTSDFFLDTKNHTTKYFLKKRTEVDEFKITFVDTGLATLPGERLLRCKSYIPKEDKLFMVTYGDGVADIRIDKLLDYHKKHHKLGTITGVHPRTKYGLVEVDDENNVLGFQEKPILSDWVNGGYMVFDTNVFAFFKENESEHPALKRLAKKKELVMYKHRGFWFSVDTAKEHDLLNVFWHMQNAPWKVWQ